MRNKSISRFVSDQSGAAMSEIVLAGVFVVAVVTMILITSVTWV